MQHILISQLSVFFNTFWNKPIGYFHLITWFILLPNLFIPSIFLYHKKRLRYIINNSPSIFNYCLLHVLDKFNYSFCCYSLLIIRNILEVAFDVYCKNFAAKNHFFCFILFPQELSFGESLIILRVFDLVTGGNIVWHSKSAYLRNRLISFSTLQLLLLKRVFKPLNRNKFQA